MGQRSLSSASFERVRADATDVWRPATDIRHEGGVCRGLLAKNHSAIGVPPQPCCVWPVMYITISWCDVSGVARSATLRPWRKTMTR